MLSLSQTTIGQITIGHVINLASNDVHKFHDVRKSFLSSFLPFISDLFQVFLSYHFVWLAPLQLIAITVILYREIGWIALIATFLVVIQVPLQVSLAKLFSIFRYVA